MTNSRWKCPNCTSTEVQISVPTWYRETQGYELTKIDTCECVVADSWYCETCGQTGEGRPVEVQS